MGHLYYAHRAHRSTDCDAKAAYTKYLELQPSARDAERIKGRVAELRC